MKFAETRLAEAISLLQQISPSIQRGDKRRSRRMSLRIALEIKPVGDETSGQTVHADLHDISARGLAVRVVKPIAVGCTFLAQLPVQSHDKLLAPLICRVAHCHDQGDNSYLVGAEFIGQTGEEPKPVGDLISEEERIRNSILS